MELKVKEVLIPNEIDFNYDELKAELMEKANLYATVVYTDEQIALAKKDRAALNKLKSAINDERIRREKEYMKPFADFKSKVNEIIAIIDKPVAIIDKQIKEAEKKEAEEKRAKIEELFAGIPTKPDWLTLDQIWDDRWLNKGVSMRMIEDNMLGWCGRIDTELRSIAGLAYGAYEAAEEYKQSLDLGKAIATGQRMAEIQRRKAEEETRKAEAEARKQAEEKKPLPWAGNQPEAVERDREFPTQEDIDEVLADEEPAPVWMRFDALLTVDKAKALKAFCDANGIQIKAARG